MLLINYMLTWYIETNCYLLQVVRQLQQLSKLTKLGSAYGSKPSVQQWSASSHHSAEPAAMSQQSTSSVSQRDEGRNILQLNCVTHHLVCDLLCKQLTCLHFISVPDPLLNGNKTVLTRYQISVWVVYYAKNAW